MEKESKNYEIGYLVVDDGDEKEVIDLLKGYKAESLNEGRAKKIKLAYPIKKQVFAHFGYVQFALNPEMIKPLREQLKLNNKVLRSLIFVIPAIQTPKSENMMAPTEGQEKPKEKRKIEETAKRPKADIVDNELLEKKLEEILK